MKYRYYICNLRDVWQTEIWDMDKYWPIPTFLIDFFENVELMERGGAINLIIDRTETSKGSSPSKFDRTD